MKKTSKFLLAENPMLGIASEHILHTRKPRFLAKVNLIEFEQLPYKSTHETELVSYVNADSLLELYAIEVIDNIDNSDSLAAVLSRMADWWVAYLKWEDAQGGEAGHLLQDYNRNIPGLKIIYSDDAGRWGAIYMGNAESFATEPELDSYLENELHIKHEFLNEGIVNYIRINSSNY